MRSVEGIRMVVLNIECRPHRIYVAAQDASSKLNRSKNASSSRRIERVVFRVVAIGRNEFACANAVQRVRSAHTLEVDVREIRTCSR